MKDLSNVTYRARKIYRNSFRWLTSALVINAFLLTYGLVSGDGSTPSEVVIADAVFLGFSIMLIPLSLKRSRWALGGSLFLGIILLLRSIGDPDFEAAFEEPLSTIPELAYLVTFTAFSFIQTLSSYGAFVLRRAGVIDDGALKAENRFSSASKRLFHIIFIIAVASPILAGIYLSGSQLGTEDLSQEAGSIFYVVTYHWGYAFYDENFHEVNRIQAKQGGIVTLYAIPAEGLQRIPQTV